MKKKKTILIIYILCSISIKVVCQNKNLYKQQLFKPEELKTYKDVIYSNRPNYQGLEYSQKATGKSKGIKIDTGLNEIPLKMDIVVPPDADMKSKRPLIIFTHGGAYHTGSKQERLKEAMSYAAAGYIAATINYRLLPVSDKRDSDLWFTAIAHGIEDLQNAIRFLKANENRFFVDTGKVVTIGTSAGAILSLVNATTFDKLAGAHSDFPGISSKVQAAIGTGGEFISKTKGLNPMMNFNSTNSPMMFFHAKPNDSGPAKATWDDNAVPLQGFAQKAGASLTLVPQPNQTHTVDMTLGDSPYWKTDLLPFLMAELKL